MPPPTSPPQDPQAAADVIAFLKDRSYPCPRCAYDLRNAPTATCPECGEPLILKIGSPRASFGWLLLAMAPGCFSGVAACFVLIPVGGAILGLIPNAGVPIPVKLADLFGFSSAASIYLMYRYRHHLTSRPARQQAAFAIAVWLAHILAFGLFLLGMWLTQ